MRRKEQQMIKFLIELIEINLSKGMSPQEAVDKVAEEQGLYIGGKSYNYLLQRAKEINGVSLFAYDS